MRGNTHVALGLLFALGAKELLQIPVAPLDGVICVLGALLPDIDEPSSTISKPGFFLFPFIPRLMVNIINFWARIISRATHWIFGHRTITHWALIPIGLISFAMRFDSTKLLMLGLGYSSHLLGDICTVQGIPLLVPLSFKNISIFKIRVGGVVENIFATVLWCGLLYYFLIRSSLTSIITGPFE